MPPTRIARPSNILCLLIAGSLLLIGCQKKLVEVNAPPQEGQAFTKMIYQFKVLPRWKLAFSTSAEIPIRPMVWLGVTQKAIWVDRKAVLRVSKEGRVDPIWKHKKDARSYLIKPLEKRLEEAATQITKNNPGNDAGNRQQEVMILPDATLPFRLLTEILYTAGQARYRRFYLVVCQKKLANGICQTKALRVCVPRFGQDVGPTGPNTLFARECPRLPFRKKSIDMAKTSHSHQRKAPASVPLKGLLPRAPGPPAKPKTVNRKQVQDGSQRTTSPVQRRARPTLSVTTYKMRISDLAKQKMPHISLGVSIESKGFFVIVGGRMVPTGCHLHRQFSPTTRLPTIAKVGKHYDMKALNRCMVALRKLFPTHVYMILSAEPNIRLQTLISTMDAIRETRQKQMLFPHIMLSAMTL